MLARQLGSFATISLFSAVALGAVELNGPAVATSSASASFALGSGSNRMLVVGVSIESSKLANAKASVRFNGVAMKQLGSASAGGKEIIRTQLFYLSESALPAAGAYKVESTLSSAALGSVLQIVSLKGVAQSLPVTLNAVDSSGNESISLTGSGDRLSLVASGNCGEFKGAGLLNSLCSSSMTSAIGLSNGMVKWTHSGANRLALSTVTLVAATSGSGPATPTPTATPAPAPTATPIVQVPSTQGLIGYASLGSGTSGGAGGRTIVVNSLAELKAAAASVEKLIIVVNGVIKGNEALVVKSNKSIVGQGSSAVLEGVGLKIGASSAFGSISNVIIQNLRFEKVVAPTDAVAITYGAHHVWVDHCEFSSDLSHGKDYYDGLLDVTHAAEFVTVSWNKFRDHYKVSLVGHSDSNGSEDTVHLKVTYHHNMFSNVNSRNASIRFGSAHLFNNYYLNVGGYGIASRNGAEVVVENNYFDNVAQPMNADTGLSPKPGRIRGEATNFYIRSGSNSIQGSASALVIPYAYSLDPAADVATIVSRGVGPR